MIPETAKEYQQLVENRKLLIGKLLNDYALIFERDESVEIIPEYDEEGQTGFVTAQTWGTWNPQEVNHICIDDIIETQIIETWK